MCYAEKIAIVVIIIALSGIIMFAKGCSDSLEEAGEEMRRKEQGRIDRGEIVTDLPSTPTSVSVDEDGYATVILEDGSVWREKRYRHGTWILISKGVK